MGKSTRSLARRYFILKCLLEVSCHIVANFLTNLHDFSMQMCRCMLKFCQVTKFQYASTHLRIMQLCFRTITSIEKLSAGTCEKRTPGSDSAIMDKYSSLLGVIILLCNSPMKHFFKGNTSSHIQSNKTNKD